MKNRLVAILLTGTLIIGTCGAGAYSVYGAQNSDNSSKTENAEGSETPLTKEEINQQINDGTFVTGSQQNYIDNQVDVDEDIEEEVEELIPEEWQEIKISTVEDLEVLAKNCRLDTWSANKHVILQNDISLAGSDFVTIPYFAGKFDGQGYKITGYSIRDNQSGIGFFSETSKNAVISNLWLSGKITPSGTSSIIGGLVGRNNGKIYNCSFDGTIAASDYVGGLVGINKLSGMISECTCSGFITGEHFTGGICGENMGNILNCTNDSKVNTTQQEVTLSLEDINIDKTINLLGFSDDTEEKESDSMRKGIVDTGGIAGLSIGVIQNCVNNGYIGYEKIGYNVGGIAGRQSGYLTECTNNGKVYGRKDVGGIVGQAEPYVTIDFTQDTVRQLSDNISKLHDIISVTLNDADGQSDAISNRLSVIQQFTNSALDDTAYLSDNTITFVDGVMNAGNQAISRVDYILDESAKSGGIFDSTNNAIDYFELTVNDIEHVVNDLDIYDYMTAEDQAYLLEVRNKMQQMGNDADQYSKDMYDAYENYYRNKIISTDNDFKAGGTYDESSLKPVDADGNPLTIVYNPVATYKQVYEDYKNVKGWAHFAAGSKVADYPDTGGTYDAADKALEDKVKNDSAADISASAKEAAEKAYAEKYGSSYLTQAQATGSKVADILINAVGDMYDTTDVNSKKTADDVKKMAEELKKVNSQTKDIVSHVNEMPDIELPQLGDEYRAHATNLNNNLRGMSDNFGYLNSEMNNASDVLIGDLSAVNDQFNVIMMLYTDAIDGVLDKDYSTVIEDDSTLVAETCVDATVDKCINLADVDGSINVAGIVGTMAIEYDYDLESDVTGIKDANMNSTYLTKCVLRNNVNRSSVNAQKSYAGGTCGLQEMGTIIGCENYGKVDSASGDYVGGIAGQSLSDIIKSYAKCILEGGSYIGGIAGSGSDISGCLAMPTISEAKTSYGAIAGEVASDGIVRNNYFVNDDLAGINRVSYSKKAEPVTYEDLLAMEGIPGDFGKMTVTFVLDDDDEISVLDVKSVPFASSIDKSQYPSTPAKAGYYTVWDTEEIDSINKNIEITANYERLLTTLASNNMLSNNQSAVLVDGLFRKGAVFEANKSVMSNNRLSGCIEYWDLAIPEDGLLTHQVRYLVGDKYRDEIGDDFEIYTIQNGIWAKAKTDKMGAYTTFDVAGSTPVFQVINVHREIGTKTIIIIAVSATILILAIVLICIMVKRRKRRSEKVK